MMSPWDILEIEPTDDLSMIKKAYSKKLKMYHPEDDPEGYQMLREAYDQVSKQAKRKKKQRVPVPDIPVEEVNNRPNRNIEEVNDQPTLNLEEKEEEELFDIPSLIKLPSHQNLEWDKEDAIEQFFDNAEDLYNDFPSRIEEEKWLELLDDDLLWDMELKQRISEDLLIFITQHYTLPKHIWLLLENQFEWRAMMESGNHGLDPESTANFLRFYKQRIGIYPSLSFEAIKYANIDHDEFLSQREEALGYLLTNELDEALLSIERAEAIFAEDPDLLRVKADTLFKLGIITESIALWKKYLTLRPTDIDAKMFLARALYNRKMFSEAQDLCDELLASHPEHTGAISLKGKILLKEGRLEESRQQFKDLKRLVPYDAEAVTYLSEIHQLMGTPAYRKKYKHIFPKASLRRELQEKSFMNKLGSFIFNQFRLRTLIPIILVFVFWNIIGIGGNNITSDIPKWVLVTGSITFLLTDPTAEPFSITIPTVLLFLLIILCVIKILREWRHLIRAMK